MTDIKETQERVIPLSRTQGPKVLLIVPIALSCLFQILRFPIRAMLLRSLFQVLLHLFSAIYNQTSPERVSFTFSFSSLLPYF